MFIFQMITPKENNIAIKFKFKFRNLISVEF